MIGKSIDVLNYGDEFLSSLTLRELGENSDGTWRRLHVKRRDGAVYVTDVTIAPVKNQKGSVINYVAVFCDITEQVRLEEQLRQSQKMEAIGKLAGGIAHDFNNMLSVIMGNAELALDDIKDDGPRQNLKQILDASRRSRELVKQILAYSRKTERQRKRLRLSGLVKETAKLLRCSMPSTIAIELDLDAPSDTILADPSQIQQVLMNISANAAHAMSQSGGTFAISLREVTFKDGESTPDTSLRPGRYIMLRVSDTGTGIPENIRHHIFEPFFTTKEPGKGTGMGLAVVFGIVKSHQGAIIAESKVDKGSTFTIFFPSVEEAAEEKPNERSPLPTGKEHLLVVDDEPSVVTVIAETLKHLGYQVTTAMSGAEALKKFEDSREGFDLVITDEVMPEITGMVLAERMLEVQKDLSVILITGYSEAASLEKTKAAGIRELLMKPVIARELAQTVRRVLDGRNRDNSRSLCK